MNKKYKVTPILTDCEQHCEIESGFKKLSGREFLPFLKILGFDFKRAPKMGLYLLPDKNKLQGLVLQLDYKERLRIHNGDRLLLEHIKIEKI